MVSAFYESILSKIDNGEKAFVLLIDPDEYSHDQLEATLLCAREAGVDYIFVGGSLITQDKLGECMRISKKITGVPVVLFPGSNLHFHPEADAMLMLSLISGRNADLLIGRHVEIAPFVKRSGIETLPTGYMLIEGGCSTSVSYMSNTQPVPADKPDIAASTAQAGELLGLKCIYMDAGSGAKKPVSPEMIRKVKSSVDIPLFVGGGLRSADDIRAAGDAGADVIIIGNAVQNNNNDLADFVEAFRETENS